MLHVNPVCSEGRRNWRANLAFCAYVVLLPCACMSVKGVFPQILKDC